MPKDNGGSAFPSQQGECMDGCWNDTFDPGMSLRDWFAGQVLAGFREPHGTPKELDEILEARATWAYAQADAMLKAMASDE